MNKLVPLLMTLALLLVPVGPAALAQQQLTDPAVVKIKTDVFARIYSRNLEKSIPLLVQAMEQ